MEMVLCVWLTTVVLWFPASALMWSGQRGFRGQTGATVGWFGIFFPPEANRMSLMNHSVFELSHLAILQSSPSSLACTTWKGRRSEIRNMLENWRCIRSRKRRLRDKDHKSNVGHNRGERLWVTHCGGFKWLGQSCSCCAQTSVF